MKEIINLKGIRHNTTKVIQKIATIETTMDIEVFPSHHYKLKTGIVSHNSVSLVAGATPGMHFPESRFYIRRMRLCKFSELIKPLEKAGYHIEPCFGSEETTVVVEIPVDVGEGIRTVDQVSMWEQLSLAAFLQRHWADNQVSCTVTFQEDEANQIEHALNYFQYQLKGVSFLPKLKRGAAYPQMPYEEIDEERYKEINKKIKPIKFKSINNEQAEIEKFCSSDTCELKK